MSRTGHSVHSWWFGPQHCWPLWSHFMGWNSIGTLLDWELTLTGFSFVKQWLRVHLRQLQPQLNQELFFRSCLIWLQHKFRHKSAFSHGFQVFASSDLWF